jgi:hypothetical protein
MRKFGKSRSYGLPEGGAREAQSGVGLGIGIRVEIGVVVDVAISELLSH